MLPHSQYAVKSEMKVLKFGGSSLRDAQAIRRCTAIVLQARESGPVTVVCSAVGGVTDSLISAARMAEAGDEGYQQAFRDLQDRHQQICRDLRLGSEDAGEAGSPLAQRHPEPGAAKVAVDLTELLSELAQLLHGVSLIRDCSRRTMDLLLSFGERLSCSIVAGALSAANCPAEMVDARSMVVTDEIHGSAAVRPDLTRKRLREALLKHKAVAVVTGFIAATEAGVTTTLGRNGSDLTATLVGAALDAEAVEIWTDVDGVLSADPRDVPGAFVLPRLSVGEAIELAHFGARVIHPATMEPAAAEGLPVWIRNTARPELAGSVIADSGAKISGAITGLASLDRVALLTVEGSAMVGVPGSAARLFSALAAGGINILMISQGSSEHSICFVVEEGVCQAARRAIEKSFLPELERRTLLPVKIADPVAIIAVVGHQMAGTPGLAGRVFGALGQQKINVLAIAQGSSEINISLVVDSADRVSALRSIHDAFFPSRTS